MRRTSIGESKPALCIPRRTILLGALGALGPLVTACDRPDRALAARSDPLEQALDAPLRADFAFANGRTIRLDFFDRSNFRLLADGQSSETMAIDGEIYLHIRPLVNQAERLWRFGELNRQPRTKLVLLPKVRPTLIPAEGIAHWGVETPVYDVTMTAEGTPGLQLEATIAKAPALAWAQWTVATSLLPAMDMSICGNGIELLTRSWNADLTGQGWAVLATSDGFRLDRPVQDLMVPPSLPEGVPVREIPPVLRRTPS